jgi:hypothetical protein
MVAQFLKPSAEAAVATLSTCDRSPSDLRCFVWCFPHFRTGMLPAQVFAAVRRFEDLIVWQLAVRIRDRIHSQMARTTCFTGKNASTSKKKIFASSGVSPVGR